MTQAVSPRLLTAEAWVRVWFSPSGFCGGQNGNGAWFLTSPSVFLCQYHFDVALHIHIPSWGWIICPLLTAVQRHTSSLAPWTWTTASFTSGLQKKIRRILAIIYFLRVLYFLYREQQVSRLGGVMVSVLAIGPKVRGFKLGRGRWNFKSDKYPQHAFLRRSLLCPLIRGIHHPDTGNKLLWNTEKYLRPCTLQHPKREPPSNMPLF
jgi:hypothetical protein